MPEWSGNKIPRTHSNAQAEVIAGGIGEILLDA
jgi:hypothetical protein